MYDKIKLCFKILRVVQQALGYSRCVMPALRSALPVFHASGTGLKNKFMSLYIHVLYVKLIYKNYLDFVYISMCIYYTFKDFNYKDISLLFEPRDCIPYFYMFNYILQK